MRIQRCQESLKDMYKDSNIFDDSNCDISSLKLSGKNSIHIIHSSIQNEMTTHEGAMLPRCKDR